MGEKNPDLSQRNTLSLCKLLLNYGATQGLDKIWQPDHRYPDLPVREAETGSWLIGFISSFVFLLSPGVGCGIFRISNKQSSKLKYCLIVLQMQFKPVHEKTLNLVACQKRIRIYSSSKLENVS